MNTRIIIATLFFLSAFIATWARADAPLAISTGGVTVVHTKEAIATAAVGDPTIADVAMEGESAVMVFGKKPGETDLVLMNGAHRQILAMHVLVGVTANQDTIVIRRPGNGGIADESWFCRHGCMKVPKP
jgi:Flp pilus assembly secretin CpaC